MSVTPNMPTDAPSGPPLNNPLSAAHYAALMKVLENAEILEDSIQRAHHIGLDVGAHATVHERNKKVAQRILAMYPKPMVDPLAQE
jgi:hypothetical protein